MRVMILLATAGMLGSSPALASVVTLGSTNAESCYRAAESGNVSSRSIEACNIALAADPLSLQDRVGTYVNRGILWMASGDLARANQDFDRALALDSKEAEAWLNKAVAEINSRDIDAAGKLAERALALGTQKPAIAYYIRGVANEESGNLKGAYDDFKRAVALAPSWREPTVELARYQVRSR